MKLPAHALYKPSGVEWLGDVPEHWEVKRAATLGRFSSSGIDKKWVDGETPVQMFNYLDVYRSETKALRYSEELMWTTAEPERIREHAVRTGDILVTPSSETEDDIGHAAHVVEPPPNIVYSYHLVRFRVSAACDSRYLVYSINAPSVRSYFESVCSGTTRMVLVRDDMRNARFALPPLAEQRSIAAFLDRETGRVDRLVATQREMIERLKEKRTALISRTVTRGLPPAAARAAARAAGLPANPPLKPSGVASLGDIPKHWEAVALKHLVSIPIIDGPHETPLKQDSGTPFVSAESVAKGSIDFEKIWGYISEEDHKRYSRRYKPRRGDVLLIKLGATTGTAAIVETDADFNVWVPLAAIRLKSKLEPRLLLHILRSRNLQDAYQLYWTFGTQQTLGLNTISELRIPVPPLPEQAAIAAYLDEETAKLDALVGKVEEAVERLQEYRTALITAAVTGKIDVRKAALDGDRRL